MNKVLNTTIEDILNKYSINNQRKAILHPLVVYIKEKLKRQQIINLNFICTHNSRRSHLAQVWAQFASYYYNVQNVNCYSGGTEVTAIYPKIVDTLSSQGMQVIKLSDENNPIYAIKFSENKFPVIAFSKEYHHQFNPASEFAAILTCSQADSGCPYIVGAEKRIPITYDDPKIADGTSIQDKIYIERSNEIALEMMYVFAQSIKSDDAY